MKTVLISVLVLLIATEAVSQSSSPSNPQYSPQIVEVRSGTLHLKAYFWKPAGPGPFPAVLFNHGSGAADAQHTAGQTMAEAAETLAPLFLKHGYAFFYLCRRGQGLSADQAPFMQDLLQREESTKGKEARQQLHYKLVTTDHLDDALSGLQFLKTAPGIDPKRIAIVGHSFGGVITLLSESNSYRCPAGQQLNYGGRNLRNRTYAYIGTRKRCGACALKAQCTSGVFRFLAIHMDEPARQRARELVNTAEFAKAQRQRKKVEALFAELKNQIGLRRLRLRRLKFVREQFFLAAVAQNIKRLVRFLSQPTMPILPATA